MKKTVHHQLSKALIRKATFYAGEEVNFKPPVHQLWIVVEGRFKLSFLSEGEGHVISREVLLLPAGRSFVCRVYEDVAVFSFSFPSLEGLLEEVFPKELHPNPSFSSASFHGLLMTPVLEEYTRHLSILMDSYPLTPSLSDHQSYYLLLLLKEAYPLSSLCRLFSPLFPTSDLFSTLMWTHSREVRKVSQLAALCHLSIRSFERHFTSRFGVSPGQWLLKRRIEWVEEEIMCNDVPLTLIADKCGFPTLAQLSDFCKKYLGASPTKLRKDGIK